MAGKLGKIIVIISQEIKATKKLFSQKPPLKKALEEFIKEFKEMELDN